MDSKEYVQLGTDLLSEDHNEVVPFRNGDFVSPKITFSDGKFLDSITGFELDPSRLEEAKQYQEITEHKLGLSDKVVNGDLLRFYAPEGFTPVDRTQYNYNNVEVIDSDES